MLDIEMRVTVRSLASIGLPRREVLETVYGGQGSY